MGEKSETHLVTFMECGKIKGFFFLVYPFVLLEFKSEIKIKNKVNAF